jgi:hypothetical protein
VFYQVNEANPLIYRVIRQLHFLHQKILLVILFPENFNSHL